MTNTINMNVYLMNIKSIKRVMLIYSDNSGQNFYKTN